MWSVDTLWFDVALITGIRALGNIFFGHFEEYTPKWRRVVKLLALVGIAVLSTAKLGRAWTFGFLAMALLGGGVIHAVILPRRGINGWTGEPREKYYAYRGWDLSKLR